MQKLKLNNVCFTVIGLPPKKDLSYSVWTQSDKINALRKAAFSALGSKKIHLNSSIEILITIFASPDDGDLDNFIGGILDGLQESPPGFQNDSSLFKPKEYIIPDDKFIEKIIAVRCKPSKEKEKSYSVTIIW